MAPSPGARETLTCHLQPRYRVPTSHQQHTLPCVFVWTGGHDPLLYFLLARDPEEGLNVSLPSFTYLSRLVSSNPKPPQNWGLVSGARCCWACSLLLVAPLPGAGLLPAAWAGSHWGLGAETGAQAARGSMTINLQQR